MSTALYAGYRIRPHVFLVSVDDRTLLDAEYSGRPKYSSTISLPTINLKCNGPESKPDHRGERSATFNVGHGTAKHKDKKERHKMQGCNEIHNNDNDNNNNNCYCCHYYYLYHYYSTHYGLDCSGWNPSEDEIFRPSRPALGPTQLPVKWVSVLSPRVKCGRGVVVTTHSLLVPRSWKSSYNSIHPLVHTGPVTGSICFYICIIIIIITINFVLSLFTHIESEHFG